MSVFLLHYYFANNRAVCLVRTCPFHRAGVAALKCRSQQTFKQLVAGPGPKLGQRIPGPSGGGATFTLKRVLCVPGTAKQRRNEVFVVGSRARMYMLIFDSTTCPLKRQQHLHCRVEWGYWITGHRSYAAHLSKANLFSRGCVFRPCRQCCTGNCNFMAALPH